MKENDYLVESEEEFFEDFGTAVLADKELNGVSLKPEKIPMSNCDGSLRNYNTRGVY